MDLKGSRTEKNLLAAFAGESQARNRYSYFASQAAKEGLLQIQSIFEETANQEREHAKRFFKFLEGGEVKIEAAFPAGVIGTTADNLKAAADGERYENTTMYPEFAGIADEEGFGHVAEVFRSVAVAEKRHEDRYTKLRENLLNNEVFTRKEPVRWACRNCGYVHFGTDAPGVCPACAHRQSHFEIEAANY